MPSPQFQGKFECKGEAGGQVTVGVHVSEFAILTENKVQLVKRGVQKHHQYTSPLDPKWRRREELSKPARHIVTAMTVHRAMMVDSEKKRE